MTTTRWTPKHGKTVLDDVRPDYLPHFRFALRRNGHIVALYLSDTTAYSAARVARARLSADTWEVSDRGARP